ncbi:unnamed protein product [Microthlaspi erraticum]|uniref:Uncharacterized protein n=1 Tax=Microthlaspi erraticum TaxID=1685480 RepID=A0A6D2JQP9_9BRAS|nr:unnamed protein product [Microthlaspi erraticum]
MDFIKTSSLRALIELTFQRNWNGFIWMSRKGVIAKRVKTAPDGSIENQRPTRSPAGRGTNVPRSAKTIRPTEVSAKVQTVGRSRITTRETARGRPRHNAHATPRTTKAREPGNASRPRNSSRVPRPTSVRAGELRPSGRETIGQIFPSDHGRP